MHSSEKPFYPLLQMTSGGSLTHKRDGGSQAHLPLTP